MGVVHAGARLRLNGRVGRGSCFFLDLAFSVVFFFAFFLVVALFGVSLFWGLLLFRYLNDMS